MPTGYTCKVRDGEITDSNQFLWEVAHQFGGFVCIPSDFTIDSDAEKFIKISTYYERNIQQLQKELEKYQTITDEELQKQIQDNYNKSLEENKKTRDTYRLYRKRYEDMLSKVKLWTPPTSEHENIKRDAIIQLETSIECDCNEEYINEPVLYDVKEYRKDMLVMLTDRLSRAYQDYNDQLKVHRNRVEWMKALQDSLK